MNPNFLAKIFKEVYRIPVVQRLLKRKVYGHLYAGDTIYMYRYSVIAVGTVASRLLAWATKGAYDHVRLHVIMKPDADRELHNHPFNYRTFVLKDWYHEHMLQAIDGEYERLIDEGETEATNNSHFHRIAHLDIYTGVTTLFCMGKDVGEWGFMVDDGFGDPEFMPSKEFFKTRNIDHDGRVINNAEGEHNPFIIG